MALRSGKLVGLIEGRFGVTLDTTSHDHLGFVASHYDEKRDAILHKLGEAGALASPAYAKAVLISEAARMALREIAPKRRKRKKK